MLVFERRKASDMDHTLLEDTSWVLQILGVHSLIEGTRIIIQFYQEKITRNTGCQNYRAQYNAVGDQISLPMVCMLGEVCGDEAWLAQEMVFTEYLELSTHKRLEGERLELFTATGATVVFERDCWVSNDQPIGFG